MVKVNIYRDFTGDYIRTHYTCMKCWKTAISENEEKMLFCPFAAKNLKR